MSGFRGQVQDLQLNLEIFNGPLGSQGLRGTQGLITGGIGVTGARGFEGPRGLEGAQGAQGIDLPGPQGAQGIAGTIGSFGNIGSPGPQGNPGFPGNPGTQGSPSPLPDGPPGDAGVQGSIGPAGGGEPGPQGTIVGPPGPQGADGVFTGVQMATAMIYRNNAKPGLFETDSNPTFQLIRGRLAGGHDCGATDISVWNQPVINNLNVQTFDSELPGEVAGFQIQTSYDGVYWFCYNLTLLIEGEGASRVLALEAQSSSGSGITIPGSRSTATVDDRTVHVSQSFIYQASAGEQIGVYASNLNGLPNICVDIGNSNFIAKLLNHNL